MRAARTRLRRCRTFRPRLSRPKPLRLSGSLLAPSATPLHSLRPLRWLVWRRSLASQVFPGAPVAVMAFAGSMEVGKLIIAGWLAAHWSVAGWKLRTVLVALVTGLALINAAGVFGKLVDTQCTGEGRHHVLAGVCSGGRPAREAQELARAMAKL
jgi:hypothetical protein